MEERRKGKLDGGGEEGKLSPNLRPREGQRLPRACPAPSRVEGPVLLPARARSPRHLGAQVAAERGEKQAGETQHQGERGERGCQRQQRSGRVLRQPRAGAQLRAQPVDSRSSKFRAARLQLEQQLRAQRRQYGRGDAQKDHRGQHPAAVRPGHGGVLRA